MVDQDITPVADPTNPEAPLWERLRVPPSGVNLFHQSILSRLNGRLDMSHRAMSNRAAQWDEVDRVFSLYHPDAGKLDQNLQPVDPIVVPAAYALHGARMTQMVGMLLTRSPIFQYRGVGPEDHDGANVLEAAIHHDAIMSRMWLQLYTLIADADRYGVGWVTDWWEDKWGWRRVPMSPLEMFLAKVIGPVSPFSRPPQGQRVWTKVSELCRVRAVDPRMMYPDPRVPLSDPDSGEFIGRKDLVGFHWLLARSMENGGPYFNLDAVRRAMTSGGGWSFSRTSRGHIEAHSLRGEMPQEERYMIPLEEVRIRIVPREWKLSPSNIPEVWQFAIAGESIIVMASPSPYDHDSFGYSVAEVNHDPHASFNPGTVEMVAPMQRAMTWLLTAHYDNVRRTLNDMLVYLPSVIYEEDLLNPGPMRHIRVTPFGENAILSGQISLREAFQQLQLADITGGHLGVMHQIFEMAQRMAAAADPQMSTPLPTKRTLGEVEAILGSSSKRMAMVAKVIDEMAFRPLALRMASNRQQFTTMEFLAAAVGATAEKTSSLAVKVSPQSLAGSFDYEPVSPTDPPNPEKTVEAWSLFLQAAGTLRDFPGFGVPDADGLVFDLKAAFKEFARATGVRNVERFFKAVQPGVQPAIIPDVAALKAAESGALEAI